MNKKTSKTWQEHIEHLVRLLSTQAETIAKISPDSDLSKEDLKKELLGSMTRLGIAFVALQQIGTLHGFDLADHLVGFR